MRLFNQVVGHMQSYYIDRDVENLNKAIKALASEAQEPQLQEAIITIPIEPEKLTEMISENEGFLEFRMSELDADRPVEAKKLVRVKAQDQLFDIMVVARLDNDPENGIITLVPAGGVE